MQKIITLSGTIESSILFEIEIEFVHQLKWNFRQIIYTFKLQLHETVYTSNMYLEANDVYTDITRRIFAFNITLYSYERGNSHLYKNIMLRMGKKKKRKIIEL